MWDFFKTVGVVVFVLAVVAAGSFWLYEGLFSGLPVPNAHANLGLILLLWAAYVVADRDQ